MTTEQLLEFCALPDTEEARQYVEDRRGLLEEMQAVCDWDKGLCPLPEGVIPKCPARFRSVEFEYIKVEPRMVYLRCPDCGGRLSHQRGGFMTSPPRAWYVCDQGHRHMFRDGYPKIEYVETLEN